MILYTALPAQQESEAQEKIPNVPMSDLQVGCIYTGHMIATILTKCMRRQKVFRVQHCFEEKMYKTLVALTLKASCILNQHLV